MQHAQAALYAQPLPAAFALLPCSCAGGEISFLQDAEATLSSIYKRPVQLDPSFLSRKQPVPPRVFLARMLNNLKQVGEGAAAADLQPCPSPQIYNLPIPADLQPAAQLRRRLCHQLLHARHAAR